MVQSPYILLLNDPLFASRKIDFAKFDRLELRKGDWNDRLWPPGGPVRMFREWRRGLALRSFHRLPLLDLVRRIWDTRSKETCMQIRLEQPGDIPGIFFVETQAFGRSGEPDLVDQLRAHGKVTLRW
jgi:hypothetical protein